MMSVIHKIIDKLITIALYLVLKKVVTHHQHGFINGRSIKNEILIALMDIDYVKPSKQECILLKLDLDKEYNRIG